MASIINKILYGLGFFLEDLCKTSKACRVPKDTKMPVMLSMTNKEEMERGRGRLRSQLTCVDMIKSL